jgi:hypothetical protein
MTSGARLLFDANLLVLFVVGTVNRGRIETFKRTSRYTNSDYDLLIRVLDKFQQLYTVPHVLAEVNNLTDLSGPERLLARAVLKETISMLSEIQVSSGLAAAEPTYDKLGLADAAIGVVAREHACAVLTDDLDLYLQLGRENVEVFNFNYLRAQELGI